METSEGKRAWDIPASTGLWGKILGYKKEIMEKLQITGLRSTKPWNSFNQLGRQKNARNSERGIGGKRIAKKGWVKPWDEAAGSPSKV